jgi:hypothetical protein
LNPPSLKVVCGDVACGENIVIGDWIVFNQAEYQSQFTYFENAASPTCVLALAQPISFWDQSDSPNVFAF